MTYRIREILFGPALVEFTLAAAVSMSATRIAFLDSISANTAASFIVNLSGAASDGRLLTFCGIMLGRAPTITIDGNSLAANIAKTRANGFGGHIWVYYQAMTGPRLATASVSVTGDGNSGHVIVIVLIKGAIRDAMAVDFQFNIGTASASVTPASAPNLIVAVALGRASFFGAHSWTNVTEGGVALIPAVGSRSGSVAFAQMLRQRFILFCSILIPATLQTINVQSLFRPSPRNEVKYVT